jgi:hypothetical protein
VAVQWLLIALAVILYVGLPVTLFTGWKQWVRRPPGDRFTAFISLPGFVFASMSAALAIGTTLYSIAIGGFRFYAPSLLVIYRFGFSLALGGFILGLGGVWKRNPLRWHAPLLSLGMFLLWLLWASGE